MNRLSAILFLIAAITIAGCDSADPDGGGLAAGQAQVTVTGDVQASFETAAAFTAFQDETEAAMLITLGGTPGAAGYLQIFAEMMPATGTFPIGPQNGAAAGAIYVHTVDGSGVIGIPSASGTLTITSASATSVVGSITFTGPVRFEDQSPDGQGTVQASFNAISGPGIPG